MMVYTFSDVAGLFALGIMAVLLVIFGIMAGIQNLGDKMKSKGKRVK